MSSFPTYVPKARNPPEDQLSYEQKEYLKVLEEYREAMEKSDKEYEAAHQKLFDYERALRQIQQKLPVGYGGKSKGNQEIGN
jgi:hypothetical protein